jgi:hypothetical protein
MKLAEQIEAYKKVYRNTDHQFKCGVKCQRLHTFLDNTYSDAVKEFKTTGTKNNANYLKLLLQ